MKYYVAPYRNQNTLNKFIKESSFEIVSNRSEFQESVNKVAIGDRLFLWVNSADGKKINAVGEVSHNYNDGKHLKVNWVKFIEPVDAEGISIQTEEAIQEIPGKYDRDLIDQRTIKYRTDLGYKELIPGEDDKLIDLAEELTIPKDLRHALSTKEQDDRLIKEGYKNQGLIGYLESEKSRENTMLIAYFLSSPNEQDYLYTTNPTEEHFQNRPVKLVEELGHLGIRRMKTPSHSFHRYFKKSGKNRTFDHFYCIRPNIDLIRKAGYVPDDKQKLFLKSQRESENDKPLYVYSSNSHVLLFDPIEQVDLRHHNKKQDKKNAKEQIRSRAKKSKIWWFPVDMDLDKLNSEGELTLSSEILDNKGIEMYDLLLVANTNRQEIEAIYQVNGRGENLSWAHVFYLFEIRTTYKELEDNKLLISSGFSSNINEGIAELAYDEFEEIINTTELEESDGAKPKEKFEIIEEATLSSDNPTEEDLFGTRDRLAKLVVEEINDLWSRSSEAFTIHLNGEWGIGKSSMLFSFKRYLNNWKIIEYNAWQNQRLEYPWWILINKVNNCLSNWVKATWWKFRVRNLSLIITLGLFTILITLMLGTGVIQIWFSNAKSWNDSLQVVATATSLITTLFLIIAGLFRGIFHNNISASDHIKTNASDPYSPIKKRFENLINNQCKKGNKIAIIIDDLDRCGVDATVNLLEGIQTLFKNSKVLYIIAADGEWISNCFDKKYKEFESLGRDGHTVGSLFLEKSIQLTVDVPNLSEENKNTLINDILPLHTSKQPSDNSLDNLNEIRFQISQSESEEDVQKILNKVDESSFEGEIREEAARKSSEIIQKKHYLEDYFKSFSSNPRQIKRLINQYIVKRQELILTGVSFDVIGDQALAKYLLFSSKFPNHIYEIKKGKKNLEAIDSTEINNLIDGHLTTEIIRNVM